MNTSPTIGLVDLADPVALFLACGGQIKHIPFGTTGATPAQAFDAWTTAIEVQALGDLWDAEADRMLAERELSASRAWQDHEMREDAYAFED